MTEEEKIAAGILFCPGDKTLKAIKLKTHNPSVDYNATHEDEVEKRNQIIHEIVGSMGEGCFFQGPIAFHYGKHTKIGSRLRNHTCITQAVNLNSQCPCFGSVQQN